jgi:hypothetical protein
MVGVTVRNNDEVELGEINIESFDVMLKDFGVIAGVKEDPFTVVLNQSGKSPIASKSGIGAKGVVKNGDAVDSGGGTCEQDKTEEARNARKVENPKHRTSCMREKN